MRINNYNVDSSKIFLRSSNNGVSYNFFRRKKVGDWNKASNWTGIRTCRECGGFFGIDEEFHGFGIIDYGRHTIEMCEWRGRRVRIDNNKICVSEYRVVAINADIPNYVFNQCGYNVLRDGGYIKNISSGKWVIFGGNIERITGGSQYFHGKSLSGQIKIAGGNQHFYNKCSAGQVEIFSGYQDFFDRSSAGNARIISGSQRFYNKSSAGQAEIIGGYQEFFNKSSAGNAKIFGGHQYFYDGSSHGNTKKAKCYKRIYEDMRSK